MGCTGLFVCLSFSPLFWGEGRGLLFVHCSQSSSGRPVVPNNGSAAHRKQSRKRLARLVHCARGWGAKEWMRGCLNLHCWPPNGVASQSPQSPPIACHADLEGGEPERSCQFLAVQGRFQNSRPIRAARSSGARRFCNERLLDGSGAL